MVPFTGQFISLWHPRIYRRLERHSWLRPVEDSAVADEQYRDRELSHYYDHDGCLVIKARLPAEGAP